MERHCGNCGNAFMIRDVDLAFYKRIDVPPPTWCPDCRHIRRHAHINDYVFYQRPCDACGNTFVSIFPPSSPYKVFCQSCWFNDKRNDRSSGIDYNPDKPFFPQFDALMRRAPQLGIIGMFNQNSDYCESVANCKNTYLISESSNCEDCSYCYWIQKTKDCLDCSYTHECERCYELVDCKNCYGVRYAQNCSNCSDSVFIEDCIGCSHCLFCTNLRHKEYHLYNRPCSEEEWQEAFQDLALGNRSTVALLKQKFAEFISGEPRRALQMENVENCEGNYVWNAKNCFGVFHCYEAEDCAYGEHVWRGAKDCFDSNTAGREAELLYETTNSGIGSYNVKFSRYCWGSRDTEYSNQCMQCKDLFGCVSLKPGARYSILNKQYNEEEYRALVSTMKRRMREEGEYGEFFPLSISLFGYNSSASFDTFPLQREQVLFKGWKWEDQESGTFGKETLLPEALPLDITEASDTLSKEVLACAACKRNYKVTPHELSFYRREMVPLPHECPTCRHRQRLMQRAPRLFFERPCSKCGRSMKTSYEPNRPETVLCDACYKSIVY